MRQDGRAFEETTHPLGSLGQDQERVPAAPLHRPEDLAHLLIRERLVKQVAHAADEDAARLAPVQRLVEAVGVEGGNEADVSGAVAGRAVNVAEVDASPVTLRAPRHREVPARHSLRIAVLARLADGRAAGHRVEALIGPLDAGGHAATSNSTTQTSGLTPPSPSQTTPLIASKAQRKSLLLA